MFSNKFACLALTISLAVVSGCAQPQAQSSQPQQSQVADPINKSVEDKLKERGEQATRALATQREIKEKVPQLAVIERFQRETNDREVLAKVGEPETIKPVKMEKTEQRVFYYTKAKFAIWLWREKDDSGPFQYRATMSLKDGKFDMPLHNVFTEEELKRVINIGGEVKN